MSEGAHCNRYWTVYWKVYANSADRISAAKTITLLNIKKQIKRSKKGERK